MTRPVTPRLLGTIRMLSRQPVASVRAHQAAAVCWGEWDSIDDLMALGADIVLWRKA